MLVASVSQFGHRNGVAAGSEVDLGHVVAHEHEAAAARTFEVFDGGRIGDVGRVEAAAFIANRDIETFPVDGVPDTHLLGAIELVAMFDGVDERFLEGELDAEDFFFVERKSILSLAKE